MTTLPQSLQAARLRLVAERPYLAAALWALQPVPRPGLGTLAVDKYWRLYYDPDLNWSVEELAGVLYHEICHLLRDHPQRALALKAEPTTWNIAADAEINDDLVKEGVKLPERPITPKSIGQPPGKLAEEYYEALTRLKNQQELVPRAVQGKVCNAKVAARGATSGAQGADQSAQDEEGEDADRGKTSNQGVDRSAKGGKTNSDDDSASPSVPRPAEGRCGSAATGQREAWEDPPPEEGGAPGISQEEAELIRRRVAREIEIAARTRGDVPGHWKRWAESVLRPRVDWRKELAALVRHALADTMGAVDYSYRRPSRRQSVLQDVILPSLRQPLPRVAVVIDTSGSMSKHQLARAVAEVAGILMALGLRESVQVLAVDAAVQAVGRVFTPRQVQQLLKGGGGTDMGVGLEAVAKLRPRPDVVVVITDGITPWPETPPRGMRVIVVLLGKGDAAYPPPKWAKVVRVENDEN